jgi:hypothetical protein
VPIWSQRGRGGGYALDPRWSLPLNFEATEALAVIAALTAARSMPFAAAGQRALRKVLAAMATGEAARARELAGRVRLGEFGMSGAREVVGAVERAVEDQQIVRIGYRDRDGTVTDRIVEAHGLQLTQTGSYLMGWCRLRDAARMFRLDRIVSVQEIGGSAPRRDLAGLLDRADDAVAPEVTDVTDVTEGGAMPTEPSTPKRSRRGGAPRKADHRTGADPAFARAVAAALPGVEATSHRGLATFAVAGHDFVGVDDDDGSIVVWPPGGGEQHILLRTVGRDEVRSTIEEAWQDRAPERGVAAHREEAARWQQEAPITHDDIRRVILALPGATEGPIWGRDVGFLIGSVKKTRFARFGPPEGSRVGNLLPPDDEDTLVILHCEQRPELLAASPDRFFSTPHYGGPDEPGGVILRLSEHRGPDDLREIAELLEDAWRHVAPADLVAELDAAR